MGFGYHYDKVIREGREVELRERRLHARLLDEAKSERSGARRQRRRSMVGRITAMPALLRRHRGTSSADPRTIPATIVAAITIPIVGLGGAALEVDTAAAFAAGRVLEMTDSVCRLDDGSFGRIAIERASEDEWVAVCVEAHVTSKGQPSTIGRPKEG